MFPYRITFGSADIATSGDVFGSSGFTTATSKEGLAAFCCATAIPSTKRRAINRDFMLRFYISAPARASLGPRFEMIGRDSKTLDTLNPSVKTVVGYYLFI